MRWATRSASRTGPPASSSEPRYRSSRYTRSAFACADHRRDPDPVLGAPIARPDPRADDVRERTAPEPRPQVVQLGRTPRVGGEQLLRERSDLQGLGHELSRLRPQVVHDDADVEVHVRVDVREVSGLAVERVAVQQHDRRAGRLGLPDEVGQQQRVRPREMQVRVAEPDVDLHRDAGVDPRPEREAEQRGVGEARGPTREPSRHRLRDLVGRRPRRVDVEPVPVGHDALRPDGAGLDPRAEPFDERGREPAGVDTGRRHLLGEPLQPDDLAGRTTGRGRHPRQVEQVARREARIDQVVRHARRPEEPPVRLLRTQRGTRRDVACRGRHAVRGRAPARTIGGSRTRPASRTPTSPAPARGRTR